MRISIEGVDQKWLVLIAIGASTFMSALDTSVVNAVLPIINQSFDSDIATVQWVVTIYLLIVSGLLLSFGRLGDMRGHKPIFMTGFAIFITSSALCGLAPSIEALITFRGFQALGAAMLAANSPAILTKSFPSSQRGQALGLQATMTYLGLTFAPSLGGWLTDLTSWRAVFYINIPVGMAAFLLSWRFIPRDKIVGSDERFDLPGSAVFLAGLITLLVGLNQGPSWGWSSIPTISLLTFSIVFLVVFVLVERKNPNPMLDLSLFKNRVFSVSTASAILNYIAVFSILLLLPFYLIQGRSLSPSQAGLILTIQPIIMALVAPIAGAISDRIGTRLPSVFGLTFLCLGLLLLARLGPLSSIVEIVFALAAVGFGTGTFISPNNSAIMGSAPLKRQGIAAGILATARSTGMVLGVGLAGAIFTTILASGQANDSLYNAIRVSFLFAAGFAAIGAIIAGIRD
jgi:EmrB/QacA subfamily drug resistance transporter